jgi:glycosyltransferase involved in cell wall biosynthesis
MNVCFASYQSVMMLKGGPKTQIIQTKSGLEKLGVNVSLFETWQEIDRNKIDLIHLFGANIGTYHLAREIHKIGIPMVVSPIFYSLHSSRYIRLAMSADNTIRKIFHGFWSDYGILSDICNWAKMVLPNTRSESGLLEDGLKIPAAKLQVVPNGVEEHFANGNPDLFRKTYGFGNFILNVGHIGPGRKNVLRLIHAVKGLDIPTVIIGRIEDNSYGKICIEEAKSNPNIHIIDALPNDSDLLTSAYAASNVFVLPSLFETPGIAALEAALAGAKIVITKYGGTSEYFGTYAEYVDPFSVASIRKGILHAMIEKKSDELQKHIRNEFLWDRVAEKTYQSYQKLLTC